MNVKSLIMSQPAADIADTLVDRLGIEPARRDRAIERIMALIDGLRDLTPEASDDLLLGIHYVDEEREYLQANLYRKDDLPAALVPLPDLLMEKSIAELTDDEVERAASAIKLPQSYGFELSPWREVLGYEVDASNVREVGAAAFCAAVLYEMTFFGFDEKVIDTERQKLDDAIRESEELDRLPPEERAKHFFSAEEVFAELGLPKLSEKELQETHRKMYREMLTNSLRTYRVLARYVG